MLYAFAENLSVLKEWQIMNMKNSRNILFLKKKWHGSQAKENIMESGRKEKFETGDIFIDISISSLSSGGFLHP